jgi:hypothetical protein
VGCGNGVVPGYPVDLIFEAEDFAVFLLQWFWAHFGPEPKCPMQRNDYWVIGTSDRREGSDESEVRAEE